MSWFTVRRGRLEYRGQLTKPPFAQWCATKDGRETIARVAGRIRFSILGRTRSARRRVWRDVDGASRDDSFATAVDTAMDLYLQAIADLSYADALPRAHVAVRRLVLVPRALAMGRVQADVFARFHAASAFAGLEPSVRAFLLQQIALEMDAAVRRASPSPRNPVLARDGWACVGVRVGTVWMDALWAGPDGTGHLFMYELPPQGLSRRDGKALDAAMNQMSDSAASLSRAARDTLLRAATLRRA